MQSINVNSKKDRCAIYRQLRPKGIPHLERNVQVKRIAKRAEVDTQWRLLIFFTRQKSS